MSLKKEITFIYMESSEKANFTPVAEEAKKRGYKVKFTTNKFEKCEIGFYCQHVNFPQFSKFSVIMLHDIIQQFGNWPDIWLREPWNKYDIGILPSNQWVDNWNQCSQWYYTRARHGIYKVGWPKADVINNIKNNTYKEAFFNKYHLDMNKRTILYAPSWENDNKQDEFVKAMLPLNVNILIKQWDAPEDSFPEMVKNIKEMYELHKDMREVTILPPDTNIFHAIAVSDVLISEESSTMAEAVMMGIPAISVSNWLIPDVTPRRFPVCEYDFVISTEKENLRECVGEIISNYGDYKLAAQQASEKNFSNIGNSSSMIMDIVDGYFENDLNNKSPLQPVKRRRLPVKRYLWHKLYNLKMEIYHNYRVRFKILDATWQVVRKVKYLKHK